MPGSSHDPDNSACSVTGSVEDGHDSVTTLSSVQNNAAVEKGPAAAAAAAAAATRHDSKDSLMRDLLAQGMSHTDITCMPQPSDDAHAMLISSATVQAFNHWAAPSSPRSSMEALEARKAQARIEAKTLVLERLGYDPSEQVQAAAAAAAAAVDNVVHAVFKTSFDPIPELDRLQMPSTAPVLPDEAALTRHSVTPTVPPPPPLTALPLQDVLQLDDVLALPHHNSCRPELVQGQSLRPESLLSSSGHDYVRTRCLHCQYVLHVPPPRRNNARGLVSCPICYTVSPVTAART